LSPGLFNCRWRDEQRSECKFSARNTNKIEVSIICYLHVSGGQRFTVCTVSSGFSGLPSGLLGLFRWQSRGFRYYPFCQISMDNYDTSSILLDCHNQHSYGTNYCTPDESITFKTSMTGSVDDTKGQTNDLTSPQPMPLQQLIARMQSDSQLWGGLLHVSGAATTARAILPARSQGTHHRSLSSMWWIRWVVMVCTGRRHKMQKRHLMTPRSAMVRIIMLRPSFLC
jgi:hypothetical protein